MDDFPLQSISIADFRRLEGHRVLPLDAPIVLMHGPNGTGKTSVLSALELALTGEVRSMRRHDPRYTAHLPFHGQEFATVRATVSDQLSAGTPTDTMTVGGSRIEGRPALGPEEARFYAERCYLDQVSLGQLLELYQYREGKEESALARFVNELLGLEELDALWSGLSDATDFRRLKRLSEPLAEAEVEAQRAGDDLSRATVDLSSAQEAISLTRAILARALQALNIETPETDDEFDSRAAELLQGVDPAADRSSALNLSQALMRLGGRIEGLSGRPSVERFDDAQAALLQATARYQAWRDRHAEEIDAWRRDAAQLDIRSAADEAATLDVELRRIELTLSRQDALSMSKSPLEGQLANSRAALDQAQARLAAAWERAGSLAEGLASLRGQASSNICPVCDRDFSEVSSTHLTAHLDRKIAELTNEGARLRQLRERREAIASDLEGTGRQLEQLHGELWTEDRRAAVESRRSGLQALRKRLQVTQSAIDAGAELQAEVAMATTRREETEALAREVTMVRSELSRMAQALGVRDIESSEALQEVWRRLDNTSAEQLARAEEMHEAHSVAVRHLELLRQLRAGAAGMKEALSQAAERKLMWESRVRESRRRQSVARTLQAASSTARTAIIDRVFTDSLNRVWRDVFTRLAPREPFIPTFGVPTSGKAGLDLRVETVHRSGVPGGSPQMMLSAGNLNTAALSLFIALHLAVKPTVPCLVLDDPVQSMDEVHIAQFAGLIRMLSKKHQRQIIIAVHERVLFQYLALELSPAYAGDELLTIELREPSNDNDQGVTRHVWSPDSAIAV